MSSLGHATAVAAIVAVALVHGGLIVFLIAGGPMSVRQRRVAPLHLAVAAAVGAVFALGLPCPLTVLEDMARAAAGWSHGGGVGFTSRYVLGPLGLRPGGVVTVVLVVVWVAPTAVGHGVAIARRSRWS